MVIKLRKLLGLIFLIGFMAQPMTAAAQFSDSWDFMKALKDQNYAKMLEKLTKGANINVRDSDGFPTIVVAADMRNKKLIKFLLENGANPDATILGNNETALMRRADVGDLETIVLLVKNGADVNFANKTGETALMRAIRSRKNRVIIGLIELGADVERADYTGRTSIDYAEETRSTRILRIVQAGLEQ
jgi:ankyrin repeat protein